MTARSTSAVIFDFDFTLVDSSRGVIECVDYAFGRMNLPRPTAQAVVRTIGLPLTRTFSALAPNYDASMASEFSAFFVERADQAMADLTDVFPQVGPMLTDLRRSKLSIAIVSTKFRYRIQQILQRNGLLHAVDLIIGAEDVESHKPDPEGLLKAMDKLALTREQTVYVGDHPVDAIAAHSAGLEFFAVLTGASTRPEFSPHPVSRFLDDLSQLLPTLEQRPNVP